MLTDFVVIAGQEFRQLSIGKPKLLGLSQRSGIDFFERTDLPKVLFHFNQLAKLIEEPGIDERARMDFVRTHAM
jgi:hypothetical protein